LSSAVENNVLEAFKAIHALNVVHGDVRPANILVGEDGNQVWIIDFEVGQILADGDEEMSNEMQVVNDMMDMLKDIKNGRDQPAYNRFPESEPLNGPLEVY
jgi:RIO-like serine/threonine protein kinase